MTLERCVVFLSPATIRQYDALATRSGQSRSFLMRAILDRGIPEAERYAAGLRPPAAGDVPDVATAPVHRPGRSSRQVRARQLAQLETVVRRFHEESPDLDTDAVRRLVVANAQAYTTEPVPEDLLEQALVRVFSQRSLDAPEPVPDNAPPE